MPTAVIRPGRPRRIVIMGSAAAGKSTLAVELGERLQLPVYHLDHLHWGDDWEAPTPGEWQARLDDIVGGDAWIIDGNFTRSLEQRLDAADLVVMLDIRRPTALWRALKRRAVHRWRRAPGVPGGDRPMFDLQLLRWIWGFRQQGRPELLRLLAAPSVASKTVVLRTPADVAAFLSAPAATVFEGVGDLG